MKNLPKYLVYATLPPETEEEIDKLREKYNINEDGDFLHCTLLVARAEEKYEKEMVKALMPIARRNFIFKARLEEICLFDKNSVVVKVKSPDLLNIHGRMLEEFQPYSQIDGRYFGANYNPHVTIGKNLPKTPREMPKSPLYNVNFDVNSFCLAKKGENDKKYTILREFPLLIP